MNIEIWKLLFEKNEKILDCKIQNNLDKVFYKFLINIRLYFLLPNFAFR